MVKQNLLKKCLTNDPACGIIITEREKEIKKMLAIVYEHPTKKTVIKYYKAQDFGKCGDLRTLGAMKEKGVQDDNAHHNPQRIH